MILKGAVVMPAGSGKTTLSKKYKNIYDIDSLHSKGDEIKLNNLYKEVSLSGNWEIYNKYEISLIKEKINNLLTPFLLLLHCKEKADLLNLTYLGACKTSKNIMEKIATERGKTNKLREEMTRNNWTHIDANIFESHEAINKYIIDLCKQNKINIY